MRSQHRQSVNQWDEPGTDDLAVLNTPDAGRSESGADAMPATAASNQQPTDHHHSAPATTDELACGAPRIDNSADADYRSQTRSLASDYRGFADAAITATSATVATPAARSRKLRPADAARRHCIDLASAQLLHPAGHRVLLRNQSWQVLLLLAQHEGKVVSRRAFKDYVWQGVVVTNDSLVQCIAEIRKAINDDRRRLIRTIPRRGYMLTAGALRISDHRTDREPLPRQKS